MHLEKCDGDKYNRKTEHYLFLCRLLSKDKHKIIYLTALVSDSYFKPFHLHLGWNPFGEREREIDRKTVKEIIYRISEVIEAKSNK